MKLKVCGMKNKANIEELLELTPDFIGFIFYPKSKRYVGSDFPTEIIRNAGAKCLTVGVFVNTTLEDIFHFSEKYALSFVQLHGDESPDFCIKLKEKGIKIIKAFGVNLDFDFSVLTAFASACNYFLFDTKSDDHGGTGKKFDWQKLKEYQLNTPFFLSGGISENDADEIRLIKHPQLFALDINSCFETDYAMKNIPKVGAFMEKIKMDRLK